MHNSNYATTELISQVMKMSTSGDMWYVRAMHSCKYITFIFKKVVGGAIISQVSHAEPCYYRQEYDLHKTWTTSIKHTHTHNTHVSTTKTSLKLEMRLISQTTTTKCGFPKPRIH